MNPERWNFLLGSKRHFSRWMSLSDKTTTEKMPKRHRPVLLVGIRSALLLAFSLATLLAHAQAPAQAPDPPLPRMPHKLDPTRYPNQAGWFPQTVSFAPDESNLLVGVCPYNREQRDNPYYFPRCTLLRYRIDTAQWQTLPEINKEAHYTDAAYTFDGLGIFAHESAPCPADGSVASSGNTCRLFVLLDLTGRKIRNLSRRDMTTAYSSLTRDGTRILYWGLSNQLDASMAGGAWDVKEFDIATQSVRQITDYQAAFPKTTPRLMPDGKRLMLAAEEYPKRPNDADFFVVDKRDGKPFRTNYVGRYGRNMTVVVDRPDAPIKPYFPTDGHMWLIVRDISRDGTRAVFDRRGVGTCFRFIEEPTRKEECFGIYEGYRVSISISSSISASNRWVAVVADDSKPSIVTRLYLIDVDSDAAHIIPLAW